MTTRRPNLFIAGHPRSGTSSLHYYLGQHPDIFMTPIKEPNFFAVDFHAESDRFHQKQLYFPYRTEARYLKLYKNWRTERMAGEASWTNFYSRMAAREIYDFNPQARIIIIFREPVDFLYSFHSAAHFALGETLQDFRTALESEPHRKDGMMLSKRVIVPSWLYYSEFISYSKQIKRYSSVFPQNQIKIVLFDELKTDTLHTYRKILKFAEVDPAFTPKMDVVNPNKVLKWPRIKKMILDSPYFRKSLRFILSDNGYAGMKNFYKNNLVSYKPRPALSEALRIELMAKFKEDVAKTGDLLNRDLISIWGYDTISESG